MVQYVAARQPQGDHSKGITYYVGGAGPIGHVGSLDVPNGLREAGYEGHVEVFTWQGLSHAGDQINLSRNRLKAAELAADIRDYRRDYPSAPVSIIALSAGTGVAAFAVEYLPESIKVDNVIFLGCSLSSQYDLTRALKRIRGGLYVVYSRYDRILRNLVWYTGTVDRTSAAHGVAGLEGFRMPKRIGPDTEEQYKKVHNVLFRWEFAERGYGGGHTDSTRRAFVRDFIAPVLMGDPQKLLGRPKALESETPPGPSTRTVSRPTSKPAATSASVFFTD